MRREASETVRGLSASMQRKGGTQMNTDERLMNTGFQRRLCWFESLIPICVHHSLSVSICDLLFFSWSRLEFRARAAQMSGTIRKNEQ
jgi:hypothetical protein